MSSRDLLLFIAGITVVIVAVTVAGFLLFERWARQERKRRPMETEVAGIMRESGQEPNRRSLDK